LRQLPEIGSFNTDRWLFLGFLYNLCRQSVNLKNMEAQNFQLTGIFVQDPIDKGFTAFFAQLPNIIAEGDTEEEATKNLIQTVQTVFEHQQNNGFHQPNVRTKQFNLSIA